MKKIAFITSHPIPYQVPLFRKITESKKVDLTVYFCWDAGADGAGRNKFDLTSFFKKKILFLARALFSQKRRNAGLDVAELMACVKCKSDNFQWNNDKTEIGCIACGKKYSIYGMKK